MRLRTTSDSPSRTKPTPSIGSRISLIPDQAGTPPGDVDLGDVAGDDRLGVEAHAGEEHLHLLDGGVLGLVDDDEGVVEGAAAHEGQGRDLDHVALEELVDLFGIEQVVEGVVERAQVGVDLLLEVAGQEAEPLAGLDRGTGEDDAVDLRRLSAAAASAPPGTSCRCRRDRSRR